MRSRTSFKVFIVFLIGTIVLFGSFRYSHSYLEHLKISASQLVSDYKTSNEFYELLYQIKRAEVDQLNYLLTHKSKHKRSFISLSQKTKNKVAQLSQDRYKTPLVTSFREAAYKCFSNMNRSISKRDLGFKESLQVIFERDVKKNIQSVEKFSNEILFETNRKVQESLRQSHSNSEKLKEVLISSYVLGVVLFLICFVIIVIDQRRARRYEGQLEEARNQAEVASKFKSEFLSHMSHEIRTPLNAMVGIADLLQCENDRKFQLKAINMIQSGSNTLTGIVNNILDFSKIESGELTLESIKVSVIEIVNDVINVLELKAQRKGLVLRVENALPNNAHITGDPTRIKQILINLLNNAIKFTEKGNVILRVKSSPRVGICIEVEDSGIGIEESNFDCIFRPFRQASSSTTREYGGTGLGLCITKNIVEKMKGELKVHSIVGTGTTFTVSLPTSIECFSRATENSIVEKKDSLIVQNLKILVADDVLDNRELIKIFLCKLDCQLEFASDGLKAVDKFKELQPDLVLMDMQMPNMGGLEATKKMRQWEVVEGLSPVPIVAFTAQAFTENQKEILAAGCNGYLAKPIKKGQLLAKISETINKELKGGDIVSIT